MKKNLIPNINLGLAALSICISCACVLASCKVGNGGSTTTSATVDNADNSINGIEECVYECDPVDADLCNDTDETNNVCFAVSIHCRGSGSFQGPDFTSTPPAGSGCVVQGQLPDADEPVEPASFTEDDQDQVNPGINTGGAI